MIHLKFNNIDSLTTAHYSAVEDYVKAKSSAIQDELYLKIKPLLTGLPEIRPKDDYACWLKRFILADVNQLEYWMNDAPDDLKFDFFKKLYNNRFSQKNKYVDSAKTYNAYTLLRLMDIKVCPYCDDEYFDILHPEQGLRRTSEFDHFYPQGIDFYPGLAMCFYNLIPSGKTCNQLMNKYPVAANPYHDEIEQWSRFESTIPLGANLDSLPLEAFSIIMIKKGGMKQNDATLALEERYNNRKREIRDLLKAARDFSDEKCEMLINMGVDRNWVNAQKLQALGMPYPSDRGQRLHQKLKYDLTGY